MMISNNNIVFILTTTRDPLIRGTLTLKRKVQSPLSAPPPLTLPSTLRRHEDPPRHEQHRTGQLAEAVVVPGLDGTLVLGAGSQSGDLERGGTRVVTGGYLVPRRPPVNPGGGGRGQDQG